VKIIKNFAKRLNAATTGGLLGMVVGKVKFRDEMVIVAAGVLLARPAWKGEGLLVGLAVAIAICIGCSLLIRLRKWMVGVPRGSSNY
jgi:hypothetical protein